MTTAQEIFNSVYFFEWDMKEKGRALELGMICDYVYPQPYHTRLTIGAAIVRSPEANDERLWVLFDDGTRKPLTKLLADNLIFWRHAEEYTFDPADFREVYIQVIRHGVRGAARYLKQPMAA